MPDNNVRWPIEPTLFWVVSYYPTNAENQLATLISTLMRTHDAAIATAKTIIADHGNEGVCTIQQVTAEIVYPSVNLIEPTAGIFP